MPRRTTEFRGFSGFDADVPNPFIRFPGGRALTSDVNDAALALDFGGVASSNAGGTRGAPTVQTPTATGRTAQPSRGLTGDNSNAGLVNRNLFRHDNTANDEWWVGRESNPNRPHEAMDFDANSTASVTAGVNTRSSASGELSGEILYSPTPGETFDTAGLHDYGEPTVQIPTSDTRYTFDDNAPSLFPDQNEWWRDGALAQGASSSPNDGGSIWEGSETIGDFGGDLSLGRDLNASLDSLQFGEDYPTIETPETPFDSLAEGTGIPIEPDVLPQEYEWTTSPGDRRFLGGPPEEETPQNVAGGINMGGTSLSNFGGNMALGPYLNMPLELMNYGRGYPVSGGLADTSGRGHMDTGARNIDPTTGRPFDLENIPTATGDGTYTGPSGDFQAWPRGELLSPPPPAGMRIIGHDEANGQPIYEDAQGNRFVNPSTGTPVGGSHWDYGQGRYVANNNTSGAQFNSRASNLMLMASQAYGGNPNYTGSTQDRGHDIFNLDRNARFVGRMENGVIMHVPIGLGGWREAVANGSTEWRSPSPRADSTEHRASRSGYGSGVRGLGGMG